MQACGDGLELGMVWTSQRTDVSQGVNEIYSASGLAILGPSSSNERPHVVILLVGLSRRALKMIVQPSTPSSLPHSLHSVSEALTAMARSQRRRTLWTELVPFQIELRTGERQGRAQESWAGTMETMGRGACRRVGMGWSWGWAELQRTDVSEPITAMAEANAAAPLGPNLNSLFESLLCKSRIARRLLSLRPTERASIPWSPKGLSPSDKDVSELIVAIDEASALPSSMPV